MMKKIIFFAVITAFVSQVKVKAQDRIAVGLKTGFNSTSINLSNVPSDADLKSEARNGFLFGAYGKLRLLGSLSLQPELYYAKKNSEMTLHWDGDAQTERGEGTFHTWDVPILANLQLIDLKILKVYGLVGPVASFIAKTSTDIPEWDDFKSTNWALQAGGGVEFWRLSADVRYEWGLSDISDLKTLDIGQKTKVLTFSLGFKLFGI